MPPELAREIARQGEARLSALASLGTASDLRATTLCGIFGAGAVAMGAALLAGIISEHPPGFPLIVSGAVVAAGLFVAAIIVGYAAAPRDFYIAGGNPDALRDWSWQGTGWCSEVEMLDATAQRYARSISANRENLERGSRRVRLALLIGCAAPTLGAAVFSAMRFS
jgi:hypothetical protein